MFFDITLLKSSDFYFLQSGLHLPFTKLVEARNTRIQESKNHNEGCITVTASRRKQKVEHQVANELFGLALFSTDLGHN